MNIWRPSLVQNKLQTGHGGSYLSSQHFGRPRYVDHLRSRVQDQPGQHGETPSLKRTKISQVWWAPVIPATREAEAGELLEPRRQRLQWAEIMTLYSSLGDRAELLSQRKKERRKQIHKSMEQKREPRNNATHLQPSNLWQSWQKQRKGKRPPIQLTVLR